MWPAYRNLRPEMTLSRIEMIATMSRMWISPPAPKPINPMAHPTMSITAKMYSRLPIIFFLKLILKMDCQAESGNACRKVQE